MKAIYFGLTGASGRMGQEILKVIKKEKVFIFSEDPKRASAWIDFSSPQGMRKAIDFCVKHKLPLVSGTTGLASAEEKKLSTASKQIPILWASNMSLGVAILRHAIRSFSLHQEGFDYQIIETHHRYKKDKPSGTAQSLQKELKKVIKKNISDPLAIRGGGVIGHHQVLAMSDEEVLSFEHTAIDRAVFARGALRAVQWLVDQRPGLYEIDDIFAMKKKRK
jgi:4-hydroxy-tetrahydrodipicolinate reductase